MVRMKGGGGGRKVTQNSRQFEGKGVIENMPIGV